MKAEQKLDTMKKSGDKKKDAPGNRMFFIDNIRWFLILLVVFMHLKVTYGDMGQWYYIEKGTVTPLSGLFFGMYGSFVQAFFMGLLFFIAGFFVPGSYDRKAFGGFIKDRLFRLGIPTLIYMLALHPITILIVGIFDNNVPSVSWYIDYLVSFSFLSSSGPLWFALALLVFSLFYAVVLKFFPNKALISSEKKTFIISHLLIIQIIVLISIGAVLIRLVQPAGVTLFNNQIGNFMQLGFFSSYVILFVLGAFSYRLNLLISLPYKFGKFWFKLALLLGIPFWFILGVLGGITKDPSAFFGGFHWQMMAYATWEAFFCVGISLGLLVIFSEKYNSQGKLSSFLSQNSFGVYVFHAPILVTISMLFRGVVIDPMIKMFLMALLVLPACFIFSHFIRKIPFCRKVFS